MNYRQRETSREIRLWVGQIIVPAIGIAAAVTAANPELVDWAKDKSLKVRNNINDTVNKVVSKVKGE